jgi:ferritin-like metal-binding protein YciE
MKTFKELLEHQLKDLYSAEIQLIKALPKMADKAHHSGLKKAFERHLEETKNQKSRIGAICSELDITPYGETCRAMQSMIKEAENFIKAVEDEDVTDAGLIAQAQRVEHYEISGYGTAVRFAKELGHRDIAKNLQDILDEEYEANSKLGRIAENRLNKKAIHTT